MKAKNRKWAVSNAYIYRDLEGLVWTSRQGEWRHHQNKLKAWVSAREGNCVIFPGQTLFRFPGKLLWIINLLIFTHRKRDLEVSYRRHPSWSWIWNLEDNKILFSWVRETVQRSRGFKVLKEKKSGQLRVTQPRFSDRRGKGGEGTSEGNPEAIRKGTKISFFRES